MRGCWYPKIIFMASDKNVQRDICFVLSDISETAYSAMDKLLLI